MVTSNKITVASNKITYNAFRMQTLLGWAARRGHVELARMLLSNGASVKSRDGRDRTPLHRACSGCHVGIVEVTEIVNFPFEYTK